MRCILLLAAFWLTGSAFAQWDEKSLAGNYSVTTGFELWTIQLLTANRANYSWHPDHPGGTTLSGTWNFKDDVVTLHLAGKVSGKPVYHEWHFVPVLWGERHYLVEESEVADFAGLAMRWTDTNRDAKAQESERYQGPFLRSNGRNMPKRMGRPKAPGHFDDWLKW